MKLISICSVALLASLLLDPPSANAQTAAGPKPVPESRLEMLKALDALKHRQARLPLPPADADAVEAPPASGSVGGLGVVNNGRMRSLYLPPELQLRRAASARSSQTNLSYEFATELFWIVSRVNNCHYCLGHQENKLLNVGVSEATLLDLDTDWSSFPLPQRAAFAFARKLTHAPHAVGDQDIESLRAHFNDDEILEMAFLVGRYNSTNRWTDSLGIPQEGHREYSSELDPAESTKASTVAVGVFGERPTFNDYASWRSEFEKQSKRQARLTPSQAVASSDESEPHERLLASLPAAGEPWVEQLRNARSAGELPVALRDKIAYVAAREDHAWYMQHHSRKRLLDAGMSEVAIFSLGDPIVAAQDAAVDQAEAQALTFARKLTVQPQSMTDDDIATLSEHFSPQQVAEIVYHTGLAAVLNRLTETAGLPFAD